MGGHRKRRRLLTTVPAGMTAEDSRTRACQLCDRVTGFFARPILQCYRNAHARPASPPRAIESAHRAARGARQGRAVPQMGGRQDLAAARVAPARPAPAAPVPRAVRRRRRPLLRGGAPPRGARRQQRRAGALLPAGARRRVRGPPCARTARLREGALPRHPRARAAAVEAGRTRCPVHLSQQDLLQRTLAREPRRAVQRADRAVQEPSLPRSLGADQRQPGAQRRRPPARVLRGRPRQGGARRLRLPRSALRPRLHHLQLRQLHRRRLHLGRPEAARPGLHRPESARRPLPALQLGDGEGAGALPRLRAATGSRSAVHQLQGRIPRKGRRTASLQCMILLALLLAAAPRATYVKAGRLFDGLSESYKQNVTLRIENDRIAAVGVAAPPGASVIDLSNATVLPGLIDCHVHLEARADRFEDIWAFKTSPMSKAMVAVVHAKRTLEAGFTSVRYVSSDPFVGPDLRDLINEGYVPGPRVVASGPCISITGGHCDLNHYPPNVRIDVYPLERDFQVADGADQLRHVIRAQVKHGVDLIKVAASGGVFSRGDTPGAPQFTYEELRVAVEEAHRLGRRIAAHAHGTQSIKDAARAGVDSVEHGTLIDDEGIRLMRERGTFLVGDIYNDDYILAHAEDLHIPKEYVDKERAIGQVQRDNWAKAMKAGVKIAFGTDAGVYPHGDNAKQFAWMVRLGLSPARAILSATAWAAELLDRQKDVGTVQAGRYADLIAVPGDPLQDVRVLERVPFVMKGGTVVKDELSRAPTAAATAQKPSK